MRTHKYERRKEKRNQSGNALSSGHLPAFSFRGTPSQISAIVRPDFFVSPTFMGSRLPFTSPSRKRQTVRVEKSGSNVCPDDFRHDDARKIFHPFISLPWNKKNIMDIKGNSYVLCVGSSTRRIGMKREKEREAVRERKRKDRRERRETERRLLKYIISGGDVDRLMIPAGRGE